MKSIIYFLYQEDKIKIGKTTNLYQRIKTLEGIWGEFNLKESFFIEIKNRNELSRLEKTIHFLFKSYKVKNLPKKDGFTEFFKIESFHKLKEFLNTHLLELREDIKYINFEKDDLIKNTKLDFLKPFTSYITFSISKDFNIELITDLEYHFLKTKNQLILYIEILTDEDLTKFFNFCKNLTQEFQDQIKSSIDILYNIIYTQNENTKSKIIEYSKISAIDTSGATIEIIYPKNKLVFFYYNDYFSEDSFFEEHLIFEKDRDIPIFENFLKIFFNSSYQRVLKIDNFEISAFFDNYGLEPYYFCNSKEVFSTLDFYTKKVEIGNQINLCHKLDLKNPDFLE